MTQRVNGVYCMKIFSIKAVIDLEAVELSLLVFSLYKANFLCCFKAAKSAVQRTF